MHLEKFQKHLAGAGSVDDDFKNETYLDFAQIILESLINEGVQKDDGSISDPFDAHSISYSGKKLRLFYYHAQARFCGALGQMIKAGRMTEYADNLYLSYSQLLNILAYDFEPELYAEFWVKELVFAHEGLKAAGHPMPDADIWNKITWRKYGFHYFNNYFNSVAYAIASEACMIKAGLGGDPNFFDSWAPVLFDGFNKELGMYADPGAPMSYDLITRQQLLYAISQGADGEHKARAIELCERGGVSSLYMQSVTGQMPYGGRTNQFLCADAFLSCFFELMKNVKMKSGIPKEAGIYKRAANNAARSIEPWLRMLPFRHIRQGFDPKLGHGIDSGGVYSVYGLLAASMLGTTYFESLRKPVSRCFETPAEKGGYVFSTDRKFHKVFASCGGYHIEIDTDSDEEKDSTGLGRFHKKGVFPETALSGSCAAEPTYSYAFTDIEPVACAIGPAWTDENDNIISLSGCCSNDLGSSLNIMCESADDVAFKINYEFTDGFIEETYHLSKEGLLYSIKGNQQGLHIALPLIQTDGMEKSFIEHNDDGITVNYRGSRYKITCENPEITKVLCANRNAIYSIARIKDHMIRLELTE